ncbi:DUF456 domain-containing protein [Bhargavaea beijingensis]|uniref:DUF456 domain-containing protein n=1 Tax=Bhargavaea beijingensis TaxID=426756 RepID=A0A1G7CT48_9BACL|nr:DUF456 domain-containing protein [Bhargavaea beijingensis]MCW1927113.1 DUF456 domain-containing protein [Bhargavaea beijingensis]RSK30838.1 DUF456 domain-containing protein [Bhargavaea beijingensis]SDE42604.1 hypothetical protein SAMN04488126_108115 [Bhargavaea beijingensis]
MDMIAWTLIILCFTVAFIGLVYPVIPASLFVFLGFVLYGLFYSFANLPWWFWVAEVLFVILLFGADFLANAVGVKRYGGTKAGMWGSTIGILVGPFVIPVFGILAGPFIGAVAGELLINRKGLKQALRSGLGSLIGFLTSVAVKGAIQIIMILLFVIVAT